MIYQNIKRGVFLERPNRFIAHCIVDEKMQVVHVKNTGRCKELLVPGAVVLLQEVDIASRKTKHDLIAVYKGNELINIDSQAPNKVFYHWAKDGNFLPDITLIKPESKFGNSRFDFYIETKNKENIFVEVKGCTLEENGVVMFPDAPTQRGVKHISQLIEARKQGYQAYIVFIIQMKNVKYFTPNAKMHQAFADNLRLAEQKGVNIIAYNCVVTEDSLNISQRIEVCI